jgi:hypothetical protein
VDYFRLPKRQYYWYRNENLHNPPPAWPANGTPAMLKISADKTTLHSVNGTDDAQIIVTVADKDGNAISNCPPVTLTIESGPGEFPTGPSIEFAADSDIAIRDGLAAIEFRSYYSGKTLIRATSPGLKDATVEITSLGEPAFIPGKTPSVKPRPYKRFVANQTGPALITLGRENPTRASSEASGHTARYANDGETGTYWQAESGDKNAWMLVDLERIVTLNKTKIVFPSDGAWRYKVEISDDGETGWKLFADQTQATAAPREHIDAAQGPAARGRFLRISVTGTPSGKPAVSEVEATGAQ